jgi:hypothetical protein
MEDAGPVVDVLRPERLVEAVLAAQSRYIGWSCALAQYLQDGVAGNQVDEQKNQRNHQPDDRKREHEAGEGLLHGLASNDKPASRDQGAGADRFPGPGIGI